MTAPPLDERTYQDYVDESLARIPSHNPEWTNPSRSDPGVTLLELFAFMAESIGYRANQLPERLRRRFLALVGARAAPGSSSRGLVTVANERGPIARTTLDAGLEVRAGSVPFRTELGLDVLPVEGRAFVKRVLDAPDPELIEYHRRLHVAQRGAEPPLADVRLYETVPLAGDTDAPGAGIALADTADSSVWIALLLRERDAPDETVREEARAALAGGVLSLGVVPIVEDPGPATLRPVPRTEAGYEATLSFEIPKPPPGGRLPDDRAQRAAEYAPLPATWSANVLETPGVVQLRLPNASELRLWTNLGPLEEGTAGFPPSLEGTDLAERVVTWVRVRGGAGTRAALLWTGINAAPIVQRVRVQGELLGVGSGEPDQQLRLARTPVAPGSVRLTVGGGEPWHEVDDLAAAGPEVALAAAAAPPGGRPPATPSAHAFALDPLNGEVLFGDGRWGARPPAGARVVASYEVGGGSAGDVGAGAIADAPALGAGMVVANPVRTWGGSDPEPVDEALRQAARRLQHNDRAVTRDDCESIVWRTPGVDLGRVDVLPAFSPELVPSAPGDAPGAITVVVLPRNDPRNPAAPAPDRPFLDAICRHLDRRRLVTTEIFVTGPSYRSLWVAVGIEVEAGRSEAEVRERVRARVLRFLAPVDPEAPPWWEQPAQRLDEPFVHPQRGWPLGRAVTRLELVAVANRVPGVQFVRGVRLLDAAGAEPEELRLGPLELPSVVDVVVAEGDPPERGGPPEPPPTAPIVPVPVIPDEC